MLVYFAWENSTNFTKSSRLEKKKEVEIWKERRNFVYKHNIWQTTSARHRQLPAAVNAVEVKSKSLEWRLFVCVCEYLLIRLARAACGAAVTIGSSYTGKKMWWCMFSVIYQLWWLFLTWRWDAMIFINPNCWEAITEMLELTSSLLLRNA